MLLDDDSSSSVYVISSFGSCVVPASSADDQISCSFPVGVLLSTILLEQSSNRSIPSPAAALSIAVNSAASLVRALYSPAAPIPVVSILAKSVSADRSSPATQSVVSSVSPQLRLRACWIKSVALTSVDSHSDSVAESIVAPAKLETSKFRNASNRLKLARTFLCPEVNVTEKSSLATDTPLLASA